VMSKKGRQFLGENK